MDEHCYAIDIYDDWGHYCETEQTEHFNETEHSIKCTNNNPIYLDEDWGYFVDIDNDNKPKINYLNKKRNIRYKNDCCYKKKENTYLLTKILIRISSTTLFTICFTYLILSTL